MRWQPVTYAFFEQTSARCPVDEGVRTFFQQHDGTLQGLFDHEQPVAFLASWVNPYHATGLNVEWWVLPAFQKEDAAKKHIHEQLAVLASQSRVAHVMWRTTWRDPLPGFKRIRLTVEATYPVQAKSLHPAAVVPIAALSSKQHTQLAQFSHKVYLENHQQNPATLTLLDWRHETASAVQDVPCVLLGANREVVAYCYWFEDVPEQLESAWIGAVTDAALDVLMQTMLPQLQAYYEKLTGEFDDTDHWAAYTYDHYVAHQSKPLITYRWDR